MIRQNPPVGFDLEKFATAPCQTRLDSQSRCAENTATGSRFHANCQYRQRSGSPSVIIRSGVATFASLCAVTRDSTGFRAIDCTRSKMTHDRVTRSVIEDRSCASGYYRSQPRAVSLRVAHTLQKHAAKGKPISRSEADPSAGQTAPALESLAERSAARRTRLNRRV